MLTKHYTLDHVFLIQVAPLREGAVICPISQVRNPRNSRSTTRIQGVCPQPPTCLPCLDPISLAPNHWRRKALFQVSMTQESLIGPAGITWPPLTQSLWLRMEYSHWLAWVTHPLLWCRRQEWGSVIDRSPKGTKRSGWEMMLPHPWSLSRPVWCEYSPSDYLSVCVRVWGKACRGGVMSRGRWTWKISIFGIPPPVPEK